MNSFNFSVVEGHLVKDPQLDYVGENLAICKFTIGNNRTYKKKNGEKMKEVHFFDITTWSKLGEVCSKYLRKGSHVLVSGMLKKSTWLAKDGTKRSRVYLEGRDVNFLSRPKEREKAF